MDNEEVQDVNLQCLTAKVAQSLCRCIFMLLTHHKNIDDCSDEKKCIQMEEMGVTISIK